MEQKIFIIRDRQGKEVAEYPNLAAALKKLDALNSPSRIMQWGSVK